MLVVISVIPPLERHRTLFEFQDTVIGNRDAVRVPAEILHNVACVLKRGLAVHDPILLVQGRHPGMERSRIFQVFQCSMKRQLGPLQMVKKLTPELSRQHLDREKEFLSGVYPLATRSQAPSRDNAVQVWMMHQILSPGMEHGREANLCAEISRVGGEFGQGFGGGLKQQRVDHVGVLIRDRVEQVR